MPPQSNPGELIVSGTLDGEDRYEVKTKWVGGIMPAKTRRIGAEALKKWLTAHGCIFCAHQVKKRLNFRCDHLEQPRQAITQLDRLVSG